MSIIIAFILLGICTGCLYLYIRRSYKALKDKQEEMDRQLRQRFEEVIEDILEDKL